MDGFYQLHPGQQADGMARLGQSALRHWGIRDAGLTLIKMRENAVFRVDVPGGDRLALRIHRHNYHSDDALRSELQWIKALEHAGIDVPRVIPGKAGDLFHVVNTEPVPEPRQVDLFEWIEGQPLGASGEALDNDASSLGRTFETIGRLAARVHNQSATWALPTGFRRHAWDAEGLTGPEPLWGRFWELAAMSDAERRLIERARGRVHEELSAMGKSAGYYSIIHADLTPENVLVDGERVRLIDFDDAGFGWHLFEIATALYFHLGQDYFDTVRDAMIAGYRGERDLPDRELDRLPLFLMARGFTYLGWVHTRHETQTAKELTPMLVEAACGMASEYLA